MLGFAAGRAGHLYLMNPWPPGDRTENASVLRGARKGETAKYAEKRFGRRSRLPLLRLCHEPISHSPHSEKVAGIGGIVFDIAAQTDDEIVDGPGVCVFMQAPDFFENRF